MTQTLSPTALPATPTARGRVERVLLDSGYSLSAFPLSLAAFVAVVTGVSTAGGLLVLAVGFALLTLTAYVARGFAHVERRRLHAMLGREATAPSYLLAGPRPSLLSRVVTPLRDAQSWLDLLWCLIGIVTGTVAFAVTVAWWSAAGGGLTYWFWQRWIPRSDAEGLAGLLGLGGRNADIVLNLGLGVLALLTLPLVVRAVAAAHAGLASALLCSRGLLQQEVRRATGGRDAAQRAEAHSLRRLERDIHDGPQQRLVRLTMDLGRARRQLTRDPERVGETLDAALVQARETVAELRSLSRGIAPPLLVDRGLGPALEEMVQRSEVPVATEVRPGGPLAPHVETALYFAASEALTNLNKHSGAVAASLSLERHDDRVVLTVVDDGIGGAHPSKGQGLAGLRQRLDAVDGRLEVDSPAGGPTTLRATVPT